MDEGKILEVLREQKVSVVSLEEGARLVDAWIAECAELDAGDETLAVEAGFYVEPEPHTFIVGTEDRIARSGVTGEVFGCEWKSTKHRTKMWGPEAWFESISQGHQIATYALGMAEGKFMEPYPLGEFRGNILVRAISKSTPPEMWPSPEGQFVQVGKERLEGTRNVYLATAAAIRGMRKVGRGPWQLPGLHCTNQFKKTCPFHEGCLKFESFSIAGNQIDLGKGLSPGSQRVVDHLLHLGKINAENVGETVVLSASSLSSYQHCPERWRLEQGTGEEEESEVLEVGTVLHAGLAELYRQQMKGE